MMMTLKENTANSMSQPIDYNTNGTTHSHSTIGYDYHHHHHPRHSWEKPTYATFDYQPTPYSYANVSSTGGLSSTATTNKSTSLYPSFDITSNLNTQSFYRRHTESTLPISTSIFSTSTANHPSPNPFNYSHTAAHYHPSDLFFGWNNGPSLMRTHSASYQDFSQSTSFPCYNPINSSTSQSTTSKKPIDSRTPYSSFFNPIPHLNVSLPAPPPLSLSSAMSSNSISHRKHSNPSSKKRPRVTAQIRDEIFKLKENKPTIFVWEIQQTLLQNGVCTVQTLPSTRVIQRVLNESKKPIHNNQEKIKPNIDCLTDPILNDIVNKKPSPITICLSPSQSSTLSDSESASECSICLETYRSGQEVSILSCSHEYHSSCIKEWMIKNLSCPMCRKDIHNQPQFVTLLI